MPRNVVLTGRHHDELALDTCFISRRDAAQMQIHSTILPDDDDDLWWRSRRFTLPINMLAF